MLDGIHRLHKAARPKHEISRYLRYQIPIHTDLQIG